MEEQKVLYIEDNILNVRLVMKYLKNSPIKFYSAKDGDAGLCLVREVFPDLILLDLNLPTISGFDVVVSLKTKPQTKHIPIIALTASDDGVTRRLCKMYGMNSFLSKPISRSLLIETMQSHLKEFV